MNPRCLIIALGLVLLPGLAMAQPSRSRIGKPMPDVALTDTMGRTVRMSDYKGSTLVILGATTW